jgi:hypothetical protein
VLQPAPPAPAHRRGWRRHLPWARTRL